MKSLIKCIFLILTVLLTACGSKKNETSLKQWMEQSDKVKILSTISQIGDLASVIGGERVHNLTLIPRDLNPHSYELVKGDDEKIFQADVIFYNGLGLEHGASLAAVLRESSKSVAIGESIRAHYQERILERNGVVDPHLWMDVSLWSYACAVITEQLSKIDPEGASYYQEKGSALIQKLEELHHSMYVQLQNVPTEKRFLVTSHDAFRYFAKAYLADPGEVAWMDRFTAPEGLSPDGQLNPVDIRNTIAFLRSHHITIVFPESNVSRDAVAKIASASSEQGFPVRLCPESLYGDSSSGFSYFAMMEKNAQIIATHLITREEKP